MVETMVSTPTWTLRNFKKGMDDQLESWLMYVPGVSSSSEIQDMKKLRGSVAYYLHIWTYQKLLCISNFLY